MFVNYSERQRSKVLKTILKKRKSYTDTVQTNRDFYNACKLPPYVVDSCLNSLAHLGYIDLYPTQNKSVSTIKILQSSYSYFTDKRTESLKYWIPIIWSNLLSTIAIIVAILAYLKQSPMQ